MEVTEDSIIYLMVDIDNTYWTLSKHRIVQYSLLLLLPWLLSTYLLYML